MNLPGQSSPLGTPSLRGGAATLLVTIGALAILVAVPVLRLDRSELTAAEGRFAQGALGALEHDARGTIEDPSAALLRGWAMVVGTTERPLRLLLALSLLIAALIAGEAAARLAGPRARPVALLVVAASTLLNRSDLLHPGMYAALPVALALGSVVALRTGAKSWLFASLLASLVAPFLGAVIFISVLAITWLAILFEESAPPRRRAVIAVLSAAALTPALTPGIIGVGASWQLEIPWTQARNPGLIDLFGSAGSGLPMRVGIIVTGAILIFGALRSDGRRRLELGLLTAMVITAVVILALPGSGMRVLDSSWAAAFLPPLALLVALAAASLPRWARAAAILALAASALLPLRTTYDQQLQEFRGVAYDAASATVTGYPESLRATRRGAPAGPMRAVLAQARALSRSGGRLMVSGPLRYGILFYSRRGHDPGVPLIAIPEDVPAADLSAWLSERVGPTAAPAGPGPTLLIHPPPQTPLPGLVSEPVPGSQNRLAWLRFSDS